MGRYDFLLEEENKPVKPRPESAVAADGQKLPPAPSTRIAAAPAKAEKPAKTTPPRSKPQVGKPLSAQDAREKIEKYTTHLEPSLIKRIKLFSIERDMKDYQVVKEALLAYFEQNK